MHCQIGNFSKNYSKGWKTFSCSKYHLLNAWGLEHHCSLAFSEQVLIVMSVDCCCAMHVCTASVHIWRRREDSPSWPYIENDLVMHPNESLISILLVHDSFYLWPVRAFDEISTKYRPIIWHNGETSDTEGISANNCLIQDAFQNICDNNWVHVSL